MATTDRRTRRQLDRDALEKALDFIVRVQEFARVTMRDDPLIPGPLEFEAGLVASIIRARLGAA